MVNTTIIIEKDTVTTVIKLELTSEKMDILLVPDTNIHGGITWLYLSNEYLSNKSNATENKLNAMLNKTGIIYNLPFIANRIFFLIRSPSLAFQRLFILYHLSK